MPRSARRQLNVRSERARERVDALAKTTGMTATQIVEEAVLAYTPPAIDSVPEGFVRKGLILVRKSGGRRITPEEAQAAIDDAREERARYVEGRLDLA